MHLDDAIASQDIEAERLRLIVEKLKVELAASRAHARELSGELDRLQAVASFAGASRIEIPKWLTRRDRKPRSEAIVCTIFSDAHLDEVVNPDEIGGLNAYDRKIATQRFERYINGIEHLTSEHLNGVTYKGCVMALGGDLVSGNLHDLAETNDGTLPETIAYWVPVIASGIQRLADVFGQVHVPVVVGNHGRLTRKPRTKKRAVDNLDWLIGKLLEQRFAGDKRVTFDVPENPDVTFTVYGTKFLMTHGDQANGGMGIAGVWSPIQRLRARKLSRMSFDWLVMGHWHQYVHSQGLIVNGSSKGYDEYASVMNFAPEPPQQALWIVTPEHGVTWAAPVFVSDRKSEGW